MNDYQFAMRAVWTAARAYVKHDPTYRDQGRRHPSEWRALSAAVHRAQQLGVRAGTIEELTTNACYQAQRERGLTW